MKIDTRCIPRFSIVLMLLALSACATRAPVYPMGAPLAYEVSYGSLDPHTEVPASDYLIPGSQVFVAGLDSAAINAVGGMFSAGGPLLAMAGATISTGLNRQRNAAGVAGTEPVLALSLANAMQGAFRDVGEARSPGRFRKATAGTKTELLMVPAARIVFGPSGDAYISFRVRATLMHAGETSEKNYYYSDYSRRPLLGAGGWAADGAEAVKEAGYKAIDALAEAIHDDIDGKLQVAPDKPRLQRLKVKSLPDDPFRVSLLREYPNGRVAVAPVSGEQVASSTVYILEADSFERYPDIW